MKNLLLVLFPLLFPGVLFAQQDQQAFQLFDTRAAKVITIDELIKRLDKIDILVFGEEHNDSIGHQLEREIFEKMTLRYPGTALSLEMFSTDVQPVLNEYLLGLISEKNFITESRAWKNYSDYRPLIEQAKKVRTDVIAANAATRYSNAVTTAGLEVLSTFPEASRNFLPPLPVDTASGKYYEKFLKILDGHSMGTMKIFQTQNLWDATMAWSLASYTKNNPSRKVLQLNGRFHSDEKFGLVAQLRKFAPERSVLTISCIPATSSDAKDLKNYANLADYVFITGSAK